MVAKDRTIALLLKKLVVINISVQSIIPNQKYVKNFGVSGHMGWGTKGIPFKTECGWTDKAKRLGYGKSNNPVELKVINDVGRMTIK